MVLYNFLEDAYVPFSTYESIKLPERKVTIDYPLTGLTDLDFAERIIPSSSDSESSTVIAKDNTGKLNINNTEEVSPSTIKSSSYSGDLDVSFEELIKLELPGKIRITSGFRGKGDLRNGKTLLGKRSNHNRRDELGNPMAYDIVPTNGDFEGLMKAICANPRVVAWLDKRGYGILEETTPDIMKKTGATGPHFHVGPDTGAIRMFNKRKKLLIGLLGFKFPFADAPFTVYNPTDEVKVDVPKIYSPLFGDTQLDWASRITSSGTPIVKDNTGKLESSLNINNTEEHEISNQESITSKGLDNNAKEAYNYLISKGIPKGSAAGIVGNLYHENLKNPTLTVADSRGTTAYGIAGFNSKGDLPNLLKWSKENGITGNPNLLLLLDYLIYVVNTRPKLNVLLDNTITPETASFIWGREFERFAGKNGKGYLNINDPEHKKRAKTSKLLFEKFREG